MNDETELKTLMIHVERIVRPIAATANRKLRMRRELLAHLHSALEEERPQGGTESEILTRAKSRLGDPAQLIQQLQLTVPRLEQLFLKKIPVPKSLDRWEQRSEEQWGLLSTFQATATGGWLLYIPEDRRNMFFNMQSDQLAHYQLICLAGGIIAPALPLLVISLLEKTLQARWYSPTVLTRASLVAASVFLWILLINSQVALRPITAGILLSCIMTGIGLVTFQIAIAKIVARMGNHSLEWKQLNLAD